MCLKIRCDGESEKFCKIFWELNKAQRKFAQRARRKRDDAGGGCAEEYARRNTRAAPQHGKCKFLANMFSKLLETVFTIDLSKFIEWEVI